MKLKKLKSIGHNAAHSYFSTLSHIGPQYTCTVLHQLALRNGLLQLELDVLNVEMLPLRNEDVEVSLLDFRQQFFGLLRQENIPAEAVTSYKLVVERLGERADVVDLRCRPELVDIHGKTHICTEVWQKYSESIEVV
ncbi:hypothetical protein [Hymenobacter cellulosilyticus]|uniref:Uncharacterized protein n=1 Tax=Hymenobacter cellulosilyticus TaxID=2932248 RepID=A0A8T9QHJ7_9BACT|nr:hypothetical protein [Hymenobacter cellulosilyticus]UOQ74283.1 hypothetical protein MUN79_10610 [Hymenobacter cellulosilyticus]